jgi:hypothetical protein
LHRYQLEDIAPAGMAIDVYDESRLQATSFLYMKLAMHVTSE